MTKMELIAWLERHGYERDRWGSYRKERPSGAVVRFKLGKLAARLERYAPGMKSWIKLRSAYYKRLSVDPETDQLRGMR